MARAKRQGGLERKVERNPEQAGLCYTNILLQPLDPLFDCDRKINLDAHCVLRALQQSLNIRFA